MERNKRYFSYAVTVVMAAMSVAMGCTNGRGSSGAGQQPFDGVAIVAHRGYWNCEAGGHARNSVAALKAAQEAGFWGSEFDVNMTADSVLLVFHDSSINGKRIDQHPYSAFADYRLENGEPIPTLQAFLEQARKSETTKLVFELKQHATPALEDGAVRKSLDVLKEYGMLSPERVMFISFSLHECRELARFCPGFTVQYLGANLWPAEVLDNGINGIDLNYNAYLEDGRYHDEARRHQMSINVWTIDSRETMEKVIATGIDQLTTDEPMLARELLGDKEIRK